MDRRTCQQGMLQPPSHFCKKSARGGSVLKTEQADSVASMPGVGHHIVIGDRQDKYENTKRVGRKIQGPDRQTSARTGEK